jgi:hypothetical protein
MLTMDKREGREKSGRLWLVSLKKYVKIIKGTEIL